MLEAKYFRDYKHSYMILPCKSRQPENSYQCRQLTSNKIEEILRCSMRHVNGMTYFYYRNKKSSVFNAFIGEV